MSAMLPATNQRMSGGTPSPRARVARGLAAWTAGIATAGLAAATAASPYGFSSGIELVGSAYDHRSTFEDRSRFTSQSIAPELLYRSDSPELRLRAFARRGFTRYRGAKVDSLVRGGLQTLDNASLFVARPGPRGDVISAYGTYARSVDALDLNERILMNPADVMHWTGGGSLSAPHAEANLKSHGWYYAHSGLPSAGSIQGNVRAIPLEGAFTSVFADWNHRALLLGSDVMMQAFLAGGGVRRQLNPWFWGEAEAGVSHVSWSDGNSATGPAGRFVVGTRREVPQIVHVEVEARRDIPTTVDAELGYRLAGGSVRLRGDWEPDIEGGVARTVEQARRITLAAEDTLGRATIVGGEVGYARLSPFHFEGPRAETIHGNAWVQRRVRTWLSARLGAAFVRQPVRAEEGEPMFRRIRLDLALIALFPGEGASPGGW